MSDINPALKDALEKEKIRLQSSMDSLLTKEGADKFIADKIKAIEPKLPALSSSMAFQCGIVVGRMKTKPSEVVTEEIVKIDSRLADVERELKPLGPIIKEVK